MGRVGKASMTLGRVTLYALLALAMTGCATLGFASKEGKFRDPNLANLNPAPNSMSPVVVDSDGDASIDPTYMRAQADYHFTMGEAMSLEGRSDKAVDEFKMTLVYDPDAPTVRLRLAAEYIRIGMMTEAIDQASTAVQLDPRSEDGRLLLGGLYSSLKMYDQALAQYQELVRVAPEQPDAPIYIGALLAEQRRFDEAVAYFTKYAQSKKAKNPERAYYYIGRVRAEQGGENNLKESEAAYTKALQLKPSYTDAVLALAESMRERGKEAAGLKLMVSFQEKFGPNREVAKVLSRLYLEKEDFEKAYSQLEVIEGYERDNLNVRVQLALILIEQKKFEAAAIRLEDILVQAPELDKIRYYLGAVYEELKNPSLAVSNYAYVPASSTYYTEATIHAAHLLKESGQVSKAVDVITKAIEARDDIPQFYAYYATLLDDQKQYRQAVAMLTKATEKFPEHAQLRFFLGSMHDRIGNSEATIASMKRVLEIDNDHVQALNYLAYTYAEQNVQLDEAEALARRALAMQPTDGYILDTVGWVLFKRGKSEAAIRYLEAAYRAKADEAIIAEHLADAYFRSQLLDKARSLYRRAAELEADQSKGSRIKEKLAATERQMESGQRLPASQGRTPDSP